MFRIAIFVKCTLDAPTFERGSNREWIATILSADAYGDNRIIAETVLSIIKSQPTIALFAVARVEQIVSFNIHSHVSIWK